MPGFSRSRSDDRRRAHRACVDRRRFGFLAIVDRDLFRRQREFCRDGALCGRNLAAHLRASGLGSAYGVGSLGKIIGPLGLGLFLGSSNVISPAASLDAILPGLAYLAMWLLATGIVFLTLAMETKGKTIDEIARELTKPKGLGAPALGLAKHER
jgi:putative MFS transporter